MRLRRLRPEASPAEIESGVARDLETGEIDAVSASDGDHVQARRAEGLRAEQRVGERQMDEDRIGAEDERGDPQAPIAADRG